MIDWLHAISTSHLAKTLIAFAGLLGAIVVIYAFFRKPIAYLQKLRKDKIAKRRHDAFAEHYADVIDSD